MKGAVDIVRPDISDGRDLDVLRIQGANQHVAFVARADHADAHRVGDFVIAKVHRSQSAAGDGACGNHAFEEVSPRDADRFPIVISSNFAFFRG